MKKKTSVTESIIYHSVKTFGILIRLLPVSVSVKIGRAIGTLAFYFNVKHRSLVYSNLKIAFGEEKTPLEIKSIAKQVFQNYGQNFIEVFLLPLIPPEKFEEYVQVEGKEHVQKALEKGKGCLLIAMHFGSWELASLSCSMLERPYKVIVKPQTRYKRLDDLLNSYRQCGGSGVIERGIGVRQLITSLNNNEIVGMVVDQGGKGGVLVPFFNKQASMSVGAMRMGLKMGVPLCFAIIIRNKGASHRMLLHEAMDLENTGDMEKDIETNLQKVSKIMEDYIRKYPSEYMWFYKIWKYSKESVTVILDDGRAGHLHQSKSVANVLEEELTKKGVSCETKVVSVEFRSVWAKRFVSLFSVIAKEHFYRGRLGFMRWFLTDESFEQIMTVKADFFISCGSLSAGLNYLLSSDQQARSVSILTPGLLNFNRFDLVVLPQHDHPIGKKIKVPLVITRGAVNTMTPEYLAQQTQQLFKRFSHLKMRDQFKIGVLIGGDTKDYVLTEKKAKMVVTQIKEVAQELKADILITTSRRTSVKVENMLIRELKKHPRCQFFVLANRNNVPEAMGGILGLADVVVVSGDSISMVSEAASSGKQVVVFSVQDRMVVSSGHHKHHRFIDMLNQQGYILACDARRIKQSVYDLAKNKIQTRKLDDNAAIREGINKII